MATDPWAGRRGLRAPVALFLATLLLATGLASWWTYDASWVHAAPEVSVEGGVVVESVRGHVSVQATGPVCVVHLSTSGGRATPVPFSLEIANVGASAVVEGLLGDEMASSGSRAMWVTVDPSLGWPRDITARLPGSAPGGNWSFIAMGDPQGHDWNIEAATKIAGSTDARFILLLGDLTPSGLQEQYDSVAAAMDGKGIPVYAVPGNHDVMNGGAARFVGAFGALDGAFDYGGVRFVLLDTSSQTFTDRAAALLAASSTGRPSGQRLVVATHTSPLDPRPHGLPTYAVREDAGRVMAAVEAAGADLMLAGHVHMYCSTATPGGVPLVVTGGGGGVLIASEGPWNFHHLLSVEVGPRDLGWTPIPLSDERPGGAQGPRVMVIPRQGPVVTLDLDELLPLATVDGTWSFEDRFGNWEGQGRYVGVPLSSIVGLVGGMGPEGRLEVRAWDGYGQLYAHANVQPDAAGRAAQGEMVLAISFDGATPPGWEEGPRIIFTPLDGRYSTVDAEATTDPSMRSDPFSAGTRWVREVASIEVLAG
jgi:predicted phosphodiesterase